MTLRNDLRILIHVTERHGIIRRDEAIRIGLPVARGSLLNITDAILVDERGNHVPAQFRALAAWCDHSVKWLLVDALVDVGTHERRSLYVSSAAGVPSVAAQASAELRVRELVDHIQIDTGTATFDVRRQGESPIGAVTIGNQPLLDAQGCRIRVLGPDAEQWQTNIQRAYVEEGGPIRVAVVCEGSVGGARKSQFLRLKVRSIFTLNSATARIECEVWNPRAAFHVGGLWDLGDSGSTVFKDVSLELQPVSPVQSLRWQAEPEQEQQQAASPWKLYQDSSGGPQWNSPNHIDRTGKRSVSFRGYRVHAERAATVAQGDRATPSLTASSDAGWIAASVDKFWQNFPKALRWSGQTLSVGLFPAESVQTFELQGGEKKRHTVLLDFGIGAPQSRIPQLQMPLQISLDPAQVASSAAVGYFVPQSEDPNQGYLDYLASIVEGPNSFVAKREVIDEYGWRNFGDLYADHEAVHHKGPEPFVSHYNNQYDFIYGAGLHFLRTADPRWREMMEDAARHTIDIDIYHTTEDKAAFSGGLFWHTDHYKQAATCTHRTYSGRNSEGGSYGGGPSNEHNYTSGLLQYHYLTGDPEAAAAVRELAQWVLSMDDGSRTLFALIDEGPTGAASKSRDHDFHKPGRGAGNSINALMDAYALTNERRYLQKAEELIQRVIHPADDIASLGLDAPETRWSYIVFLQVLGKYLDRKLELAETDYLFWYARAGLLHYAHWMLQHELPYKDVLHKVELPTETWPAHDVRKCHVFHLAARFAAAGERAEFSSRATFFFDRCLADLLSFPTAYVTRPQVILCVYGGIHGYFVRDPRPAELPLEPFHDFGVPIVFVPQRGRLRGALRRKASVLTAEVGRMLRERVHALRSRFAS